MNKSLDIQFVSDVMCPWCVVGLRNLNTALASLDSPIETNMSFQPFELNPDMPAQGQGFQEHIIEKYGITPAQSEENRKVIQARGEEVGFHFNFSAESRMRNSFDAHRLLHWAELEGKQAELKNALFEAHFTHNQDVSDHSILANIAAAVGLERSVALGVLEQGHYADEVRRQEAFWQQNGISSVPTVIINNKYAISGGQPAEQFRLALEEILTKEQAEATP